MIVCSCTVTAKESSHLIHWEIHLPLYLKVQIFFLKPENNKLWNFLILGLKPIKSLALKIKLYQC